MPAKKKPIGGPDDPRHGTPNGYTHHRCRCDLCRDAHRIENGMRYRTLDESKKSVILEKRRSYWAANREILLESHRAWYSVNREAALASGRRYKEAHRQELSEKQRAYVIANRQKVMAQQLAWRRANPEKMKAKSNRVRAKKNAQNPHWARDKYRDSMRRKLKKEEERGAA